MILEKFADHNGVRIRYLESRPPRPVGMPVVFVPGIVDSADEYVEAFECFADRPYLLVEVRGRGGSDAPVSGYSVEAQAGDVKAALEASSTEQFHLMTFSRGTTSALEVALTLPERVLSISIGDYLPVEVGLPDDFADTMSRMSWRGTPNLSRLSRHVLEGIQASSRTRDLWAQLAELRVPVMLARGTEGGFVNEEQAERYRRSIPGIEVIAVPGSGHDLFRPSRTVYPAAVADFLRRRLPGS